MATRVAPSSDSDSEYGSRSHKRKKKPRQSTEDIRVSSRGVKIPNYVDDVQDFEKFDEDETVDSAYYADPNVQYQEEDEIEAVLTHSRDEGHENDPEDLWFENIVRSRCMLLLPPYIVADGHPTAFPHQMEKLFPPPQHRRDLRVPQTFQGP